MNQKMNDQPNHKIWAIIPAAGSGSRFSKTALKQYQIILDKTVLEHTVARLNSLNLTGYVLTVSKDDDVAKTLQLTNLAKAHFCLGGAERVNSVLNGLNHLLQFASEEDWVFVHDAARPCVSIESLNALVETAITKNQNAILAIPVSDTLKRVVFAQEIDCTINREQLWQAQTPQIAKLGELKMAIEKALANGVAVTDEASALEYAGFTVNVVQGRADNIKITYPDDLALATLILQSQR